MSKPKYLHSKHLPPRMNILWLPVVYMLVGYFDGVINTLTSTVDMLEVIKEQGG